METIFADRRDAGRQLGQSLARRPLALEIVILGVPRGGVVVAGEVAAILAAPLDVVIARKIRAPQQPELGIGAVVDGTHIAVVNEELAQAVGATSGYLKREIEYQAAEIDRRLKFYRGDRPVTDISGKTTIVVDDGIATGYTFRAALEGLRRRHPARLVAAAPVAARDSLEMLRSYADEVICLIAPPTFMAVGHWYRNFQQTTDEEVIAILQRNWERQKAEVPRS